VNETINLRVPAAPSYGRIVRAAGANLATRLGWQAVDIDSLRVAIDSAVAALVGESGSGHDGHELMVSFGVNSGEIDLDISLTEPLAQPVPDDRCAKFLTATVGRFKIGQIDPKAHRATFKVAPL